jgi:hypothetical protein
MRKDPIQKNATYAEIAGASVVAAALASDKEHHPHQESIAQLAYRLWEERGRPEGSPEYDWFLAEELLRRGTPISAASTSS